MEELTPKQRYVLEFITGYAKENGMPPTLGKYLPIQEPRGPYLLSGILTLEKKGFINRRSSRGIILNRSDIRTVSIPVAGTVKAGNPSLAVENIDGYVEMMFPGSREKDAFISRSAEIP